jgi:hypothetical protein
MLLIYKLFPIIPKRQDSLKVTYKQISHSTQIAESQELPEPSRYRFLDDSLRKSWPVVRRLSTGLLMRKRLQNPKAVG